MRILIVEDAPQKAALIEGYIRVCKPSAIVENVSDAHAAFRMASEKVIDLIVLDILIPFRSGGAPTEEASIWLVKELNRKLGRERIPLVLGATQFPESKRKVEDEFGKYLWNVVVVEGDDGGWKKWLKYAIDYQDSEQGEISLSGSARKIDAAVLTALRYPELEAVIEAFGGGERLSVKETNESWILCEVEDDAAVKHSIILACAEDMGMSAMSALTSRVCLALRPDYLLLSGIMGGNKDHVGLTDLVAVEDTWDCRAGKLTENGFEADVRGLRGSIPLKHLARSIFDENYFFEVLKDWKYGEKKYVPKYRVGAVACSPAVLAYDKAFEDLAMQKRKVIGVEMEAFGCYYAAEQLGGLAPKVLAIKSVCDLGDKQKGDDLQRLAAYISARGARAMLGDSRLWR